MKGKPCRRICALLLACGIAATAANSASATLASRSTPVPRAVSACAPHAAEAAARTALSETVILRVMHVESRGRANALSPKGAMGCMQIMPATWRYLTARHGLGSDPWNARFNMIGGALYLAELARRFGFPGAYAAYNAGPERYARHVRGDARLPAETIAYMASLSGTARGARRDDQPAAAPRWQDAGLFLRAAPSPPVASEDVAAVEPADAAPHHDLFPLAASRSSQRGNVSREE